jgi:hypothetical protein
MIEQHPGGLPAPAESVLTALRGIHPGLYVVRSRYAIDQNTGAVSHGLDGKPIERPRYWLCIDNAGKKSALFAVQTPEGEYMPFDMRTVRRVGTDLGIATRTYGEMMAVLDQQDVDREEKRKEGERERFRRFVENNGQAWRAAMQNLKDGRMSAPKQARMRDPVIYGYDGQVARSTSHNTVPVTGRELGLDVEN